ncbi:MAG TPA: phosphoribosylglycinamide formyltransferase [Cyclobacteriaceae bacterium]|nr:phosphoribosylglycinamide formyltransferase [Cyclobacteriaceae bacterium]HMV08228.1 phosphoribosylglycinamide formyltransferase [Cyclobacteriaceae bacterium]HMV90997.1 phosphoribosylglycinamide formyltransferase [Cyclobacteriaceae bacterium]HMX02071.1 phosphoribosylglycinamide formyltransferase [Cyclobacteriaceae bacterium]HMX49953.1 phosphoribosylglycinamide formyltransferase [Cyclobacteriaceae bacterium]
MKPHRIAIFASGSGTNAEEILAYFQYHPSIEVKLLLSNNPQAQALQRAERFRVKTHTFSKAQFRDSYEVLNWLKAERVTHIVLAGFMWLVPDYLIHAYPGKIINIHPALLPKFGGKGMYGKFVHEAVKAAGEAETGITIHEVNEHYDEGNIVFQATCGVDETDTPDSIALKVQKLEHMHYPKVIEQWISKR